MAADNNVNAAKMENTVTMKATLDLNQLRPLLPELAAMIGKDLEKNILQRLKELTEEDAAWGRERCCEYMDISLPVLDALRRGPEPALASIRIGRSIKIMKSDVLGFMKSRKVRTKNFGRES